MSTARQHQSWRTRAFSIGAALAIALSVVSAPVSSASAQDFDISVNSISDLTGLTAVAGAGDGDGVNVRSAPGMSSDVVTTVPDGTVVNLRVDVLDTVQQDGVRWWPVSVNGKDGWIAGTYLSDSGHANSSSSSSSDSPSSSSGSFAAGAYVKAATDDGKGVNIRSKASLSADVLSGIPNGGIVQVMDGPTTDGDGNVWYKVTDGETTGYASAEWLVIATGMAASAEIQAEFSADDTVKVVTDDGTGLNLRASASRSSTVIDTLPEDSTAQIVAGPVLDADGLPWYEVDADGSHGFVIGSFLEKVKKSNSSSSSSSSSSNSNSNPPAAAPVAEPGVATGSLRYPLDNYTVTQGFGCSYLGFYAYNDAYGCPVHDGIDLAAPSGTDIHAADGGTVTAAGWCDCGLGYYVQIDHGNGIQTIYGHMVEQPVVSAGQLVAKGDLIGHVGSTGASTGPHTHFMVLVNGTAQDPTGYVTG